MNRGRLRSVWKTVVLGPAAGPAVGDRLGRWSAWFRFRRAVDVVSLVVLVAALPFLFAG